MGGRKQGIGDRGIWRGEGERDDGDGEGDSKSKEGYKPGIPTHGKFV